MNVEKNLKISLFEGIISGIHFSIANGVYITAFATKIGALAHDVAFIRGVISKFFQPKT